MIDLVDEMDWEDSENVPKLTIEEALFEESNPFDKCFKSSIYTYLNWFYDGEQDDFLF
jgi:hypothetical protein